MLSENECAVIVCKIAQGYCKKDEIPLPTEVSDFIETTIHNGGKQ